MAGGRFSVVDYVVFAATLILSIIIGLIPAWRARHRQTTDEYLVGNRNLRLVPVTLSLLVTYVSGITLLGTGTETYFFGIQFSCWMLGQITGAIFTCILYIPLLYPLKLTSSNEYLKLRFDSSAAKLLGTVIHVFDLIIIGGMVMIGSAFFLETAAQIPIWISLILVGSVATLYTCLGGIQSVIWTDVFQAVVIMLGLIVICITGTVKTGSIQRTWQLYAEGGRMFVEWIPSPWHRVDIWSVGVLQGIMWGFHYGVYQLGVQRYCSLPTYKQAIWSVLLLIPMNIVMLSMCALIGVIAYGYFAGIGCDPYEAGYIKNMNQSCPLLMVFMLIAVTLYSYAQSHYIHVIIPYLVTVVMPLNGLPGLFFAAVFSGALSSISSTLMAMAACTWEDLFTGRFMHLPEKRKTLITKCFVVFYGVLSTAVGILLSEVGGTLIQMATSVHMVFVIPLGVMFVIGGAWPRANSKAAMLGALVSCALLAWVSAGANLYKTNQQPLPSPTYNCHVANSTFTPGVNTTDNGYTLAYSMSTHYEDLLTTTQPQESETPLTGLYTVSYLWYGLMGLVPGVLTGVVASFIPGFSTKEKLDGRYIFPFLRGIWRRHLKEDISHQYQLASLS